MQLYNPSISYQSKQEIKYCFENNEKNYNMTNFRLMLAEDGFMTYNWDILESTMKRILLLLDFKQMLRAYLSLNPSEFVKIT